MSSLLRPHFQNMHCLSLMVLYSEPCRKILLKPETYLLISSSQFNNGFVLRLNTVFGSFHPKS